MLNKFVLAIGIGSLALMGAAPRSAAADKASPTPEEIDKITQAVPQKATAKPAQPRKLLVFTLTRGFKHSSVPVAAKALEILGQKTGAFETVISDDIAMFEPAKLRQFDAVCMDNTTGDLFAPADLKKLPPDEQKAARQRSDDLRKSLVDFVSGGKGLAGIHAATDCFYQWPEYGQMMGGYFNGHPWGKVIVKVDDPAHPLNAVFKGQGFQISDEIYTFKTPYSRDALRILLSVDWDASVEKLKLKPGTRQDNDYALSWVRNYGQGRVFYCAFGHDHAIFWNPAILQHYLDGIQFALGDLRADATPSARIK